MLVGASWAGTDSLMVALPSEPGSIDPHKAQDGWSLFIIYPCYQRLTSLKPAGTQVEPSLALTWRISDDGLAFTFVIKQDQFFADGRTLDAEAVAKSFQRVMQPGYLGSAYFPTLYQIQILGPYTLRFLLREPTPFFLQALATSAGSIVSPGVMEHVDEYLDKHTAGSGLYQLEAWQPGKQLVLKARDTSPSGPPISRLVTIFEPSSEKQLTMLQNGQVLLAAGLGPAELDALKYQTPLSTYQVATDAICYLALNCKRPWLSRPEARQVLAGAVDSQGLAGLSWGGGAKPAVGPLPAGMWGGYRENLGTVYNPGLAEKRLGEVGLPPAPLVLVYRQDEAWQAHEARLIKAYLEVLHIPVVLAPQTDDGYDQQARTGDFDLLLGVRQSFIPHPLPLLESWFSYTTPPDLNSNVARYQNPEVAELLATLSHTIDPGTALPLYHRLQEIVAQDTPYLFLTQLLHQYGLAQEVKGFTLNPAQPFFIPLSSLKLAHSADSHH